MRYSDAHRNKVFLVFLRNQGNITRTATETGHSTTTIKKWSEKYGWGESLKEYQKQLREAYLASSTVTKEAAIKALKETLQKVDNEIDKAGFSASMVAQKRELELAILKLGGALPSDKYEIKQHQKLQWGIKVIEVLKKIGIDLSPLEDKASWEKFEKLYSEEE